MDKKKSMDSCEIKLVLKDHHVESELTGHKLTIINVLLFTAARIWNDIDIDTTPLIDLFKNIVDDVKDQDH